MRAQFKHWLKIALWRKTSCTSASHRQQSRINQFRFVHGVFLMLILYWMDRCHWIHARQFLLVVFHVLWKLVSKIWNLILFIEIKFILFVNLVELAMIMDRLYGGVCYAGIDTDPELKYPKVRYSQFLRQNNKLYIWLLYFRSLFISRKNKQGAGRVAFSNQQSYIAAISARFVQLQHNDIDKRVEVKPYVLDDQMCDECQGQRCSGKFAPFFCANVTCLQVNQYLNLKSSKKFISIIV